MNSSDISSLKVGLDAVGKTKTNAAIKSTLNGIKNQPGKLEIERIAERSEGEAELRPIMRSFKNFLSQDPEAKQALAKLSKPKINARFTFASVQEQVVHQEQAFLRVDLHKNVHVIGPPYDFNWSWGQSDSQIRDHVAGRMGVIGNSQRTSHCAAGIGFVLTTDRPAAVSVRPYIKNNWQYSVGARGIGSWADCSGGIDSSVWVDGAMIVPPAVRHTQAFRRNVSVNEVANQSGDTVAYVDDIALNFSAVPGKVYAVNFGCWVRVGSWDGIGSAEARALSQGFLQFVVIERWV